MRIIHVSYAHMVNKSDPASWLQELDFFTKDLETLCRHAEVHSIHLINCSGVIERAGVKYHFLKLKRWQVFFPFGLHRYIRALDPDVVIVHGLVFPCQVLWLYFQMSRNVKIAVIHHAEKPLRSVKGWMQKIADRFIDAYFFTSMEMAGKWVENGQITTMAKVHEVMIGASVFYPLERVVARKIAGTNGENVFLWVGGLNENKDPLTLIRGFVKLLEAGSDASLYMIFKNDLLLGDVKALLASSGHQDRIFLVGKIAHADLLHWYNSADFIISTSHSEGSGIAVCEAMSCGCIPILTSISSHIGMTDNKRCGLFFNPGSDDDLFRALMRSKTLDITLEKGKVARIYDEKLSPEAIARKMLSVFRTY
jgi:glycosyltransferase involved in cell wall biosynthesis